MTCFDDLADFLKDWQTLFSAVLALIAAGLTIATMKAQMRQDNRRHAESLVRKRKAVRAQLPNALSDLSAYISARAMQLLSGKNARLEVPVGALNALQNAIEFVDDSAATRIFELVSWYQVWSARLSSSPDADSSTGFYDSALLMHYTTSLFGYARNERDEVSNDPPSAPEMISALKATVGLVCYQKNRDKLADAVATIQRLHTNA
ncbi:MAG: hypothetical protein WD969_02580 [Paracoccaceae bacterium]